MEEENKKLCEDILEEVAKIHKIKIEELNVMSDPIFFSFTPHMFMSLLIIRSAGLNFDK